jgi:lipopolysaccharide export LptBFGC system permease protein LptF
MIGLIAFTVIYVTVDVNEQVDDYIDFHARIADVVLLYAYKVPWILVLVMPVAVLLSSPPARLSRALPRRSWYRR